MDKLARNAFNWKALISNLVLGFASHDSDSRDTRSLQGLEPVGLRVCHRTTATTVSLGSQRDYGVVGDSLSLNPHGQNRLRTLELDCAPEKSSPGACAWQKDAYVPFPNSGSWFYRSLRFSPRPFAAIPQKPPRLQRRIFRRFTRRLPGRSNDSFRMRSPYSRPVLAAFVSFIVVACEGHVTTITSESARVYFARRRSGRMRLGEDEGDNRE